MPTVSDVSAGVFPEYSRNFWGFRVYWVRMRISRRAEYALRALLLIAKDQNERIHQIQDLSER